MFGNMLASKFPQSTTGLSVKKWEWMRYCLGGSGLNIIKNASVELQNKVTVDRSKLNA